MEASVRILKASLDHLQVSGIHNFDPDGVTVEPLHSTIDRRPSVPRLRGEWHKLCGGAICVNDNVCADLRAPCREGLDGS